jgi:hypothetical protein
MSGTAGPLPPIVTDSSKAGFLAPSASASDYIEDDALDDFFQQAVAGITGLSANLVRPLWQPEPANLPDFGTTWAAVGLVESELAPGWSYETHNSADTGTDRVETWEYCTFQASFFGPHAGRYDGMLRDGLFLPQNQEVFLVNGMGLVDWKQRAVVPVLIKERWWRRYDRHIRLMRDISRTYNIRNIRTVVTDVTVEKPTGDPPDQVDSLTMTPPDIT